MTYGQNPPSIDKTAFECPHCGAYTSQRWLQAFGEYVNADSSPHIPDTNFKKRIESDKNMPAEVRSSLLEWYENMNAGLVFIEEREKSTYLKSALENLHLSICYVCKKLTIWVHNSIVFPPVRTGPVPNADMPLEITRDFEEARSILGLSPRGAAALLRLCVQKLCDHLGHKGKKIDDAIAALVVTGLNPVVQQALDAVRVVGNEAVHPGTFDLRDDSETAGKLFSLVNIIVDRMISDPKRVREIYDGLPDSKRAAIERRDGREKGPKQ